MVSSLTALRTRIKQKYGKDGTKTAEGLFVAKLAMNNVLEEDKICYRAEQIGEGVIFRLSSTKEIKIRPLPTTQSAFLTSAIRRGLAILSMTKRTDFSPQQEKDVIVRDYNKGIGDYSVVDIEYKGSKPDMLLAKQTYMQSSTDPTHFRCYFRLSRTKNLSYTKFLDLLELLAKRATPEPGDTWDNIPLPLVIKSIIEGETELLLGEIRESDVWA